MKAPSVPCSRFSEQQHATGKLPRLLPASQALAGGCWSCRSGVRERALEVVVALSTLVMVSGCSPAVSTSPSVLSKSPRGVREAIEVVAGRLGLDPSTEPPSSLELFDPQQIERSLTGVSTVWGASGVDDFLSRIDKVNPEEAILLDSNGEAYVFLGPVTLHDDSDVEYTAYHFCHGMDSIYVARLEELRARGFRAVWLADFSKSPGIRFQVGKGILQLSRTLCSLGVVPFGSTGSAELILTNVGSTPIQLSQPETTCGCTVAALAASTLAPGDSVTMTVSVTPSNRGTRLSSTRQVVYIPAASEQSTRRIAVNALCVQEAGLQVAPLALDFGVLHPGESAERIVRLGETAISRFEVRDVQAEGMALKHSIVESATHGLREYQLRIQCTVDDSAAAASRKGTVKVTTSSLREPVVAIPCRLEIKPRVSSRPGVISFGSIEAGVEMRDTVRIESAVESDFRITSVTTPDDCTVEVTPRERGSYSCMVYSVPSAPGPWNRSIVLQIEGADESWREQLLIPCYARVLPPAVADVRLESLPTGP